MENNNCHFQVGSLVTANLSWQLALPISIGANFGHNPYRIYYNVTKIKNNTANLRSKYSIVYWRKAGKGF